MLRKNMIRTGLLTAIAVAPLMQLSPSHAAAAADEAQFQIGKPSYSINSAVHPLAAPPYMKNATTMVPLRAAAEAMKAGV
ncbi:copper amine oxidase N-terminal domain-containing protein, partial [Paenibacillus sepulcri]|nr:copper amine oxidase N-terminal domain-containing protein [Paenibacillus sepulcri]